MEYWLVYFGLSINKMAEEAAFDYTNDSRE